MAVSSAQQCSLANKNSSKLLLSAFRTKNDSTLPFLTRNYDSCAMCALATMKPNRINQKHAIHTIPHPLQNSSALLLFLVLVLFSPSHPIQKATSVSTVVIYLLYVQQTVTTLISGDVLFVLYVLFFSLYVPSFYFQSFHLYIVGISFW